VNYTCLLAFQIIELHRIETIFDRIEVWHSHLPHRIFPVGVALSHDVFVSYSEADKLAADATCSTLEAAGVRCWIAPRDIPLGDEWRERIIEAIDHSTVMVLIFSKSANESSQVRREVAHAINSEVMVIPVRVGQAEPAGSLAYDLAGVHWLDALTPPLQVHLQRLALRIKALLHTSIRDADDGVTSAPPPFATPILTPPTLETRPPVRATSVPDFSPESDISSQPVAPRPGSSDTGDHGKAAYAEILTWRDRDARRNTQESGTASQDDVVPTTGHDITDPLRAPDVGLPATKPRPWRRLFARLLDYTTVMCVVLGFIALTGEEWSMWKLVPYTPLVVMPLLVTLEALLLRAFGTTPGKALYGLSLRSTPDNEKSIPFWAALLRSLRATISATLLVPLWFSYRSVKRTGTAAWDRKRPWRVELQPIARKKWAFIALVWVAVVVLFCAVINLTDSDDLTDRGVAAYDSHEYAEALQLLRKAADQEDTRAQYYIGLLYLNGNGVAKNDQEAFRWLKSSADQDYPYAQVYVGWLYEHGIGVASDSAEALAWYRRAAEEGNADAQYDIAVMYANGSGVPQDLSQARAWFTKAAASGDERAKQWLSTHK
jgi:hypothetical protein